MLDLNTLAVDVEAAENGKWFPYPGGAEFLICRFNNEAADQMRTRLTMENWEVLNPKEGDEVAMAKANEVAEDLDLKVICHVILKDWKGVGVEGKALKYTPELGEKYLGDKRFRDLRKFVENNSMRSANWRETVEASVTESVKDTAAS